MLTNWKFRKNKKQKKSTTATIQISIHNRQIGMQKFLDSSNCTWITFHEYTTHSGHTHAIPYHPTSSSSLSSSNIPLYKTRDHHLWSSRDDHKTLKSFLERASLLSLDWAESHYGRHAALESSVIVELDFFFKYFLCVSFHYNHTCDGLRPYWIFGWSTMLRGKQDSTLSYLLS